MIEMSAAENGVTNGFLMHYLMQDKRKTVGNILNLKN